LPVLLQASCVTSGSNLERDAAVLGKSPSGAISTREFVEVATLSGLRVSPDQRFAVVREERQKVASGATMLNWRIIDIATGEARVVVDAGGPLWNNNGGIASETPTWSSDSERIYFRKLTGEEVQIWEARREGGQSRQLTFDDADIAAFEVGEDDSITYITSGATRSEIKLAEVEEHSRGVLMDSTIVSGLRMEHGFPVNGRMTTYRYLENADSGRRGTLLAKRYPRVMSLAPNHARSIQVSGDPARSFLDRKNLPFGPITPARLPAGGVQSVQDGDLIAVIDSGGDTSIGHSPTVGARRRVWWTRVGASDSPRTPCIDPICVDADLLQLVGWRPGRRELIMQAESLGIYRLIAWDITSNAVRVVSEGEGVIGSDESGTAGTCQLAADQAVCIAAASDRPPHTVAIDLGTGRTTPLYDPNRGLTRARLGEARQIRLVDRFGNTTIGRVILPRDHAEQPRLPLVITSYSCRGFLQGGSGRDVPEHVLASLGYAAACVDLGARTVKYLQGFQVTPIAADLSALDFFEQAVDVLSAEQIADPQRVAISGFSASSTHTTSTLTQSRKFTAAIVTTGGSFDAIACYLTANYRSCETLAKGQGFERPYDAREGFLKKSPAWNADKIRTPILMQLPESEYPGMMQLYGALLDYGRAVEMYVFAGAFHYKNDPRQRLTVYNRNVEWIEFWLKGVESPRADLADQYSRWRKMREGQCSRPTDERGVEDPLWYCALQH
jgi:dienelactone hydrolase